MANLAIRTALLRLPADGQAKLQHLSGFSPKAY
jgi:hypothetical protein